MRLASGLKESFRAEPLFRRSKASRAESLTEVRELG